MTTELQIRNGIYDWLTYVLNVSGELGIDIIIGEENAPPPSSPYIVIHQPFNIRKVGRVSKSSDTDSEGVMCLVTNYEAIVSIEQVGANGDNLRRIIESSEKQEVKNLLSSLGLAHLRSENINNIPDVTENFWELRCIVDIYVAFASSDSDNTNYIENIEWDNNIL